MRGIIRLRSPKTIIIIIPNNELSTRITDLPADINGISSIGYARDLESVLPIIDEPVSVRPCSPLMEVNKTPSLFGFLGDLVEYPSKLFDLSPCPLKRIKVILNKLHSASPKSLINSLLPVPQSVGIPEFLPESTSKSARRVSKKINVNGNYLLFESVTTEKFSVDMVLGSHKHDLAYVGMTHQASRPRFVFLLDVPDPEPVLDEIDASDIDLKPISRTSLLQILNSYTRHFIK